MEKESAIKDRLTYIDAAKGIAMILVVMGHVLYFSISRRTDFAWNLEALNVIAHYHMPLFVFLSGLMTKAVDMPYAQLFKLFNFKILKIIVPFLSFGLLYTFVSDTGIAHFFLDVMKHGYWYLWVLAEYYVFSFLFVCFCKFPHGRIIGELIFGVVVFASVKYMKGALTPDFNGFFSLHNFISYFPCFFGGLLIRKYQYVEKMITPYYSQLIVALLVVIGLIFPSLPLARYWHLAAVVLFSIQILYLMEKCGIKLICYLASVGRSSLDIYLLHYFIVVPLSLVFLQPYMHVPGWGTVVQTSMSFVIALPISVFCMVVGKVLHKIEFVESYIFCKTIGK